jgi:ketosteroid isomerase-like protein
MDATDQEFRSLYQAWMGAVQRRDMATLERILGADYIYTASGQGRKARQGWLETVAVYDIQAFDFPRIDVRRYGDVAVVLCDYRQTGAVHGEARSGEFLITDAWVRRDGRWQVVARSSIKADA